VSAPALAACDRVVLIEHGRVVAEGRHEHLMQLRQYRELVAGAST
jgi:ABC-type multidrug transport system fused ATPase/permease subunit